MLETAWKRRIAPAKKEANVDFKNGKELLALCAENNKTISQVMLEREMFLGDVSENEIADRMRTALGIMKDSVHTPLQKPVKSMGGLIGGEGRKVLEFQSAGNSGLAGNIGNNGNIGNPENLGSTEDAGNARNFGGNLCGPVLTKAIAYALSVLEVNASMGLIVAAPTAGSSGVVPGSLIAVAEEFNLDEDTLLKALINTSAIGYILTCNASVSGAEAGCQAEVGAASAMAASALVEIFGGSPEASLSAASMALSNLLGLVCDPIAGLVEAPCQSRNAIGVANAFTAAQMALAGIYHQIPFDEMCQAMYEVGTSLPFELRETALGGNAATPTACKMCRKCK